MIGRCPLEGLWLRGALVLGVLTVSACRPSQQLEVYDIEHSCNVAAGTLGREVEAKLKAAGISAVVDDDGTRVAITFGGPSTGDDLERVIGNQLSCPIRRVLTRKKKSWAD